MKHNCATCLLARESEYSGRYICGNLFSDMYGYNPEWFVVMESFECPEWEEE